MNFLRSSPFLSPAVLLQSVIFCCCAVGCFAGALVAGAGSAAKAEIVNMRPTARIEIAFMTCSSSGLRKGKASLLQDFDGVADRDRARFARDQVLAERHAFRRAAIGFQRRERLTARIERAQRGIDGR